MIDEIKVLDLFSGIGGISLGLERANPAFRTVAFCEREAYPRAILKKHWPEIPIYDDVRTLQADRLGRIDIVSGGYPCQPFSVAGKQLGKEDDRHLWPEMARIIRQCNPTWVLAENVAGHITMGLDEVLSDLEGQGYSARPFVIPACAIGAPHRRDRVWIIAHNDCQHRGADEREPNARTDRRHKFGGVCEDVSDTQNEGVIGRDGKQRDDDGGSGRGVFDEGRSRADDGAEDVADTDDTRQQQSDKEVARKLSKQFNSSGFQSRKNRHDSNPSGEQLQRGSKKPFYGKPNVPGEFGRMGKNVKGRQAFISKLGGSLDGVSAWLDGSWENGIPRVSESEKGRAERLKGLGNAVVPQIVEQIGRAIIEAEYAV